MSLAEDGMGALRPPLEGNVPRAVQQAQGGSEEPVRASQTGRKATGRAALLKRRRPTGPE